MDLEGLLIEDQHGDTLLYAGTAKVKVTDWFFFKDKATLKYIGLQNTQINIARTDSVWNYQFLVDYFSGPPRKDTTAKKGGIDFDLKILDLENISFKQSDKWVGQDMNVFLRKLDLDAEYLDFNSKRIVITQLTLDGTAFTQSNYPGLKPKPENIKDIVQKIPVISALQWNTQGWEIHIKDIHLNDASFATNNFTDRDPLPGRFDGQHVLFSKINGDLRDATFINDTVLTNIKLTAFERSGLEVKNLTANLKLTPAIMEFSNLDLQTNRSRIGPYFAMKYTNFNDDLASFMHNVAMDVEFQNSSINSGDLAFFAPATKSWNRVIDINGRITGPVDNLSAKKLLIRSGNSIVDGDIAMRGLPDFNTTFIDFKSNDLQTNYNELVSLMPSLRKVKQPELAKLGYIRFKGTYTGFINDFVAFGNISTNLGNINADLNMKLPQGQQAVYSGKISSTGFQLGQFINNKSLGTIALDGKVNGRGFNFNTLKLDFDGNIHQVMFSGYNYQNLTLNGTFDKKVFTGHLNIDDPNLKVKDFNGSLNLSKDTSVYNFDALLQYANLKALHLANDNFSLSGHFSLNFTGNNIDNFLGSAKVFDATLKHDSTRLSFDSLELTSTIVDGNKILDFRSNEIEGTITGKFKILELYDAFNVFLSRYYPSQFKQPDYTLSNQDFSFNIKTRVVDDYMKLIDKRLKGFNFSTFSGNLRSKENILNVSANIPAFEYDGKQFNNIVIESSGNLDTLSTKVTAGEIVISDSLRLPATDLTVSTHNDMSVVHLKTSSSTTLSDAELNATVQTLPGGAKIHFYPSTVIINEKTWQIAKDGELTVGRNYVNASEVKFVQGEQEIVLSTAPDEKTGNTNVIARLKKVNINDFTGIFTKKVRLEGMLTGTLVLKNPFGDQEVHFTGDAEGFRVDNKNIGDSKLDADLNTLTGQVVFSATTDNPDNKFDVKGSFNYKDSTDNQLNVEFVSERVNLDIVESYLGGVFSDLDGHAKSNLKIYGGAHKYITGTATIDSGSFTVAYTNCKYRFNNYTVVFKPDEIDLGTLHIRDTMRVPGQGVLSGRLYHTFFSDFVFDDMRFEGNRMLLLNTTKENNNQFYGRILGNATMSIDGPMNNMRMNIDGTPIAIGTDSSHISIPTGSSRDAGPITYIDFIQYGSKMEDETKGRAGTNFKLVMTLHATKETKVDVILDESTGDIISGRGSGVLTITTGTGENTDIRGRYDIESGQYMFNFQTFLKKYFTLRSGGYIQFAGDPYDARIKIDAAYLAKRVDISSLPTARNYKQRENITVVTHLTGNLMKPAIDFDFELPPSSPINDDYIAQKALQNFKTDKTEMNKQVASLLIFNTLISSNQNFLNSSSTISLATNSIGGIVSNMLTNLFNKQLEKATNGVLSTYFDINSNVDVNNKAALLQASVQAGLKIALSERLVVLLGGNIDYNNPYAQFQRKGLITPDISIEWMLNKDGSLKVIGFNRTNVDLTLGQRNRSGISLTYSKDFDRFAELFRKNLPKKNVTPPAEQAPKTN